jgi:hypothetical protein
MDILSDIIVINFIYLDNNIKGFPLFMDLKINRL